MDNRGWFAVSIFYFLLSPFAVSSAHADDWVMGFHDSRHTGQSSEVVTPPLTVAWTWKDTYAYDNGNGGQFFPTAHFWLPLFYQGKLYFQGGLNANRLFCLNPVDGAKIWEVDNPGYTASGTYLFQFDNYPVATAGRIVNASTDFTMTMDAATGGDVKNRYNTNGGWPAGGSAAWHNMAYLQFIQTDDYSEEFDIVTDPVGWNIGYGYTKPDYVNTFPENAFRVPAVDSYVAYVNILGLLVAEDALTGRGLWSWGKQNYGGSPAVSNGIVYFYSSSQNSLAALDARQGTLLWTVPIAGAYSPIVSDGVLYVGSRDGNFYARDAATGAPKWSFATRAPFTDLQIPAISGNLIFVPSADGTLYVLDKTSGAKIWQYNGTAAWGPVVIGGGMIFASDLTNTLYAFRPASAAIGPAETGLSKNRIANGQAVSITITGSGFFAGGASSAVQSLHLDDAAHTALSGAAASDQSLTVTVPAGLIPGTYHIKVQTTVGQTANEPALEIDAANTNFISTLGQAGGPYAQGTQTSFQRHLARTSQGTLIAVYSGPAEGQEQDITYNLSRDGGMTWTVQTRLTNYPSNSVYIYQPTSSVWVDAQDQLNLSLTMPYSQVVDKFAVNSTDFLNRVPGFPTGPSQSSTLYGGPLISEPGGRLWVAYANSEQLYPNPWHVMAAYSDDGGLTWTLTPQINQSPGGSPPVLVLFQGKPVVLYSQSGPGQGDTLVWSTWDGAQWSAAQLLPGPITGVGISISAVVTTNNQIHVAYGTAGGAQYVHYDGVSWSAPQTLDAGGSSPSLTTNGSDLWYFYANASHDLVYQRTTGGQFGQWSAVAAITNDGNQNTAASTLGLSPDATILVLWTSGSETAMTVKSALVPSSPAVGNNPQISVSRPSLTFNATAGSGNPANQTLSVTNTGTGTLSWTATKTQSWLTIAPINGGNSPFLITVSANISGLAAGTYSDTIRFSGNASNNPQVSVTLKVNSGTTSPSPLPPFTLASLNGKTFTLSDEIIFSYPVSGVTFGWDFQPVSSLSSSPAATGAQTPEGRLGMPVSRSGGGTIIINGTMGPRQGHSGVTSKATPTTSAPRLTPASAGLTPGTYQLTVTVSQAGSPSQSATATINLVSTNLNSVKVYPNPWRSDKHAAHPTITFAGLTVGTTIKIFTVSGHLAKELHTDGPSIAWDLTNAAGDKVASGIYMYLITDGQGDKVRGKMGIIK